MAARNVKFIPGFETSDKMQSSTLKRQPSPDWSKNDLLRLLSYFEGELQARDITIAALKAEKAKQLLYQAKYGRFGLGDPFVALQRDTIGTRDSNFDETAVKSMYDNQLAQLENLIATQRKAQLKMREQLANAEKRYHKVCSELEDEKRKHAQDTAQGDDVTYMLEKERERLRQEIDFEKSNCKKLEKDLRRTLAALEEERASAARHKQVALLLLKERKHILQKLSVQKQSSTQGDDSFDEHDDMREGLDAETRRSLAMEAALEQQLGEFEAERAALRAGLDQEQGRTRDLEAQVETLQQQVQRMAARTSVDSIEIKSGVSPRLSASSPLSSPFTCQPSGLVSPSVSPSAYTASSSPPPSWPSLALTATPPAGRPVAVIGGSTSASVLRQVPKVLEGGRIGSSSPEREVIYRPTDSLVRKVQYGSGGGGYVERQGGGVLSTSPRGEARVVTVGSSGPESGTLVVGSGSAGAGTGARVSISPGNSATVVTQGGGKISFHVSPGAGGVNTVGGGSGSPGRTAAVAASTMCAGRGTPPPVPPNKPNIAPSNPGAGVKPAPPPKVAVMGRERSGMDSKVVQIPVNVMASPASSTSSSPSSSSQSSRESSPIRKTAQCPPPCVEMEVAPDATPSTGVASPAATLDFLGPEMANLQELLASLSTGEASARHSPTIESPSFLSPFPSPLPSPSPSDPASPSIPNTPSPAMDMQNSAVHKMAMCGDLEALKRLIVDQGAYVDLPMKDGTTPLHCAVEQDREACLQLLLDSGANVNALRDDRVTPIHIAAHQGHVRCLEVLLERGGTVNAVTTTGDTALHLAVDAGHFTCCQVLLHHRASIATPSAVGLTAVHHAVMRDRPDLLCYLLEGVWQAPDQLLPYGLVSDNPATCILHLAAQLPSQTCLQLLLGHLPVSPYCHHSNGPSLLSAASPSCRTLLQQIDGENGGSVSLVVELNVQLEGATVSCTRIGTVELSVCTSWPQLEDQLRAVLAHFLAELDRGLRTRRLARMEAESGADATNTFTLGISMARVNMFEIGFYRWSPGMQTEKLPYSMASNNSDKKVAIVIDDTDNLCELIAFDILHPVTVLHDYLRLLEQYKSVVFHGPVNSGKSYLVQRLAQCIASDRKMKGEKPAIYQLKLSSKTTHDHLVAYLKQKGCLQRSDEETAVSPILILDNLEKVNMAELFGPLLDPLAQRGRKHAFPLKDSLDTGGPNYYFPDNFCILATLNRTRSTGIELHVQQRFRWVQFRHDAEPLRNLLARHFLRRLYHVGEGKLPASDDPLLRAAEWIICIWQRLNDSLGKLGLPDVVLGPCCFFKCPIEKKNPQLILQWVRELWNSVIAGQVQEAVQRGTGKEGAAHSQHKVVNTALYVLMQRAIVLSCPLPAKEKEVYLQGFCGSNELDLPLKSDQRSPGGLMSQLTGRSTHALQPEACPVSPRHSHKHNSNQSPAAASKTRSKHREERGRPLELFPGSSIKRRSLSESSVNKAWQHSQQEEEEAEQQARGQGAANQPASQAKVPKLEVRSSRILSLSNSFKTSPGTPRGSSAGEGKTGRVSPLHPAGRLASHHHNHHKKSRSSENISPSGLYAASKSHSQYPFSFSLSTPKSSLASFKFFDKTSSSSLAESPSAQLSSPLPPSSVLPASSLSTSSLSTSSLSTSSLSTSSLSTSSLSTSSLSTSSLSTSSASASSPALSSPSSACVKGGSGVETAVVSPHHVADTDTVHTSNGQWLNCTEAVVTSQPGHVTLCPADPSLS